MVQRKVEANFALTFLDQPFVTQFFTSINYNQTSTVRLYLISIFTSCNAMLLSTALSMGNGKEKSLPTHLST